MFDAATCGAAVVAKCSDYPIFHSANEGTQISSLNVHCGLAFGKMAGVHVGNDYNRREYLILGESIDLVTKACDAATYGELMASPEAYEILMRGSSQKSPGLRRGAVQRSAMQRSAMQRSTMQRSTIQRSTQRQKIGTSRKRATPILIAKKKQCNFQKRKERSQTVGGSRTKKAPQRQEFSLPFDKMDIISMKHLKRLMLCYVHPVVVADQSADSLRQSQANIKVAQERLRSEAELRSVYTIFIKALVQADLSSDTEKNQQTFMQLNDIFEEVTSILDRFNGHLRQFIVDDKGKSLKSVIDSSCMKIWRS